MYLEPRCGRCQACSCKHCWTSLASEFLGTLEKQKKNFCPGKNPSQNKPSQLTTFDFFQGHFNLLFHCSVQNNHNFGQRLLDNGADPSWINRAGNTVLNLYVKRNQRQMAEAAFKALNDNLAKQEGFVNRKNNAGKAKISPCCSDFF